MNADPMAVDMTLRTHSANCQAKQCNGRHDMPNATRHGVDPLRNRHFPLAGNYLNLPGGSVYFVESSTMTAGVRMINLP